MTIRGCEHQDLFLLFELPSPPTAMSRTGEGSKCASDEERFDSRTRVLDWRVGVFESVVGKHAATWEELVVVWEA